MPTSVKLSAGQKGLAPILIIVLVSLAALGGYILYQNQTKFIPPPQQISQPTPTPDETVYTEATESANWKTYILTESDLPKFSLKYPPNWQYSIKPGNFSYALQKNLPNTTIGFGELATENHIGEKVEPYLAPVFIIYISVGPDIPNINIEDLYTYGEEFEHRKIKDITVDGIPAKQISHIACLSGSCMNVLFKKNNILFDLSIMVNKKVFDQILSTFKFLP